MHQQFPQAPLLPKSWTNLPQLAPVRGSKVSWLKNSLSGIDFFITSEKSCPQIKKKRQSGPQIKQNKKEKKKWSTDYTDKDIGMKMVAGI
jgi:hypothetical protein